MYDIENRLMYFGLSEVSVRVTGNYESRVTTDGTCDSGHHSHNLQFYDWFTAEIKRLAYYV